MVSWSAPYNQGSPITGYRIYIRENDLVTYSIDWTYCDGSLAVIREARSCSIPVFYLHKSYYQIQWGDSVYAKLTAFNIYGVSDLSDAGNGAVLMIAPEAPHSLSENFSVKSATSIGISWVKATEEGGSPVIDYTLMYHDQFTSTFTMLQQGITTPSYSANGLTTGITYYFKVAARNSFGLSVYSSVLDVLCHTVP